MSIQIPFYNIWNAANLIPCCQKGSVLLKPFSFTKTERIRKSSEYRIISKFGKRHYSDSFIIVSRKNQLLRSRLGITVSKKVGKAVTRNRIKRIIREYFRVNRKMLPVNQDINVVVRPSSAKIPNAELREKLEILFKNHFFQKHPQA